MITRYRIENGVLKDYPRREKKLVLQRGITSLQSLTFDNNKVVKFIELSEDILSIDDFSIFNCPELQGIAISSSVAMIEEMAVWDCPKLLSIEVEENNPFYYSEDGNLYSREGDLLQYAPGKTEQRFRIPEGIRRLAVGAFRGNRSLTWLEANEHFYSEDGNLYGRDSSSLIRYAPGKTESMFSVPEGVREIGAFAFSGCSALKLVRIPESVTAVMGSAFEESGLRVLEIPSSVKIIGLDAFEDCENLKAVVIQPGVEWIQSHAFARCGKLEHVVLPESIKRVEAGAFAGCLHLKSIEVEERNAFYQSVDGVLFSKDGRTLVQYPAGKRERSYRIPDGVETVEDFAFAWCKRLSKLEFPKDCPRMSIRAFIGNEELAEGKLTEDIDWL